MTTEWRHISTAPKDGTYVLLGALDATPAVGFYNGRGGWDDGDFFDHMTWPTLWIPLPPTPPTVQKEAAE